MATVELWKTESVEAWRNYYTLKCNNRSVDIWTDMKNTVRVIETFGMGGIQENSIRIEPSGNLLMVYEFDYGYSHFGFTFSRDGRCGWINIGDWQAFFDNNGIELSRQIIPSQLTLQDNNYRILEELLYWLFVGGQ